MPCTAGGEGTPSKRSRKKRGKGQAAAAERSADATLKAADQLENGSGVLPPNGNGSKPSAPAPPTNKPLSQEAAAAAQRGAASDKAAAAAAAKTSSGPPADSRKPDATVQDQLAAQTPAAAADAALSAPSPPTRNGPSRLSVVGHATGPAAGEAEASLKAVPAATSEGSGAERTRAAARPPAPRPPGSAESQPAKPPTHPPGSFSSPPYHSAPVYDLSPSSSMAHSRRSERPYHSPAAGSPLSSARGESTPPVSLRRHNLYSEQSSASSRFTANSTNSVDSVTSTVVMSGESPEVYTIGSPKHMEALKKQWGLKDVKESNLMYQLAKRPGAPERRDKMR